MDIVALQSVAALLSRLGTNVSFQLFELQHSPASQIPINKTAEAEDRALVRGLVTDVIPIAFTGASALTR